MSGTVCLKCSHPWDAHGFGNGICNEPLCSCLGFSNGAEPIKERDTREMLNLIADQLRNGHVSVMAELERRMDELRARQDQDREAISSWISGLQVDLSKFIHLEIVDLRKEVREIDYGSAEWVQTRVLLDLTNKRLKALERKPRKKASKSRK